MKKDKWEEIQDNIERSFKVLGRDVEENDGVRTEWIEFENPQGKMRVEWVEKPRVVGTKTLYSKRAGTSAGAVEHVESDTEKVNFLKAYRWVDSDWQEIDAGSFG